MKIVYVLFVFLTYDSGNKVEIEQEYDTLAECEAAMTYVETNLDFTDVKSYASICVDRTAT